MYNFRDTTEHGQVGSNLPAEAMSFNGKYIENEIRGYRTLTVTGRELLSSEVTTETMDQINGSHFVSKRYGSRTITVQYQLIADNDIDFRNKYNQLNLLLKGEQVQIIFNDEVDKYFIGTVIDNTDPPAGTNKVTGEIEIFCADPLKYSTTLKEFEATINDEGIQEVIIENNGSMPVSIDYDVEMVSESGFLGLVNEAGIMQFGKIEEADGENYKQNETLLHLSNFINASDDTTGTDYMHPSYGVAGSSRTVDWYGNTFLTLNNAGTRKGNANGSLKTIEIPLDSEGVKGAKNWYMYAHLLYYAGLMGQTGEMNINFLTEDNELIAGLCWYKIDMTGNTGCYELWANGKILHTYQYTTSHIHEQNPWFWDWGHVDIRKEEDKLTFFYWGGYPSYRVPEIKDKVCTKIQMSFKEYMGRGGSQRMTYMGFNNLHFQKMNVEKWRDVPNRFPAGTKLSINGTEGKFYVNGMYKPDEEILGTNYFKADAGTNTVQISVSEWCNSKPKVVARIREAWL